MRVSVCVCGYSVGVELFHIGNHTICHWTSWITAIAVCKVVKSLLGLFLGKSRNTRMNEKTNNRLNSNHANHNKHLISRIMGPWKQMLQRSNDMNQSLWTNPLWKLSIVLALWLSECCWVPCKSLYLMLWVISNPTQATVILRAAVTSSLELCCMHLWTGEHGRD